MSSQAVKSGPPLILDIKGNSLDDGPGIRTVVFYKGCPLSCAWCHNPESKKAAREISYDHAVCVQCGNCLETCKEGALSKNNPLFIDREQCTLCFQCIDNCPSGALSPVGKEMSIKEITEKIVEDKPFYETSGGGVTLSGGEPTLYIDFTSRLLTGLKKEGIHTLLETCGHFDFEDFQEKIYPHIDMIYYDIKLYDPDEHKKYCGVSNEKILSNFSRLIKLTGPHSGKVLPRTPLIPGITATDKNLAAIADFLRSEGISRASLLAYNPLWKEKSMKIGTRFPFSGKQAMTAFMKKGRIRHCISFMKKRGIEC